MLGDWGIFSYSFGRSLFPNLLTTLVVSLWASSNESLDQGLEDIGKLPNLLDLVESLVVPKIGVIVSIKWKVLINF